MGYLGEGVGTSVLNSIDYRIRRVEERVEKSLPAPFRTNSPVYEPGWSIWCDVSTPSGSASGTVSGGTSGMRSGTA